ncbi:MAG: glycoside hydrolase family 127 protein [Alistipes sp.]|uniref:glycoside hydrolase family 127 protein n=1 Tax=Alistipes sp. TaxID=1872444 RepID=UPI0025B92F26|nr:beta-L-arabinofuranosidase domain-containing protein [Alistipes sp.]MCD8275162.1 glycoside hydrolase family 127 protein [Alistipes sp.]
MKNTLLIAAVLWVYCLPAAAKQPEQITPVPFNEVTLTEGFWKRRMQTELDVTLPFSLVQAGPAIEQLQLGAAFLEGKAGELPSPNGVLSSDLYKVMEGAAYSLMLRPDPELEAKMDSLTDIIGRAQQKDGYLFVCHTCGNIDPFWVGDKPYSKVVYSHELYGAGHLYEAAAAYYQATGKRALLDIAIKNARHVNRVFFEGDPAYNDGKPVMQAPGHEEIELALCKLYRVTGDRLYLDMAKKFLDIRGVTYRPDGEGFMSPFYAQQHAPVAEQTAPAGHAVRAVYLYTAMAQVDALTGKQHYTRALDAIWNNLVATRIYVTGGLGALASIEGFGAEYELPNLTAYSETCAAVGNVFFNQGMFLNSGEARYFDVAEISLFNNALAGINLAGDRFFYVNPLETDGEHRFNHGLGGRAPWFGCACCPPNISRMILQVPGYMYAYGRDRLYLTLYGSSRTSVSMNGVRVGVEQTSDYPFDGKVRIALTPEKRTAFRLCMRIPTW